MFAADFNIRLKIAFNLHRWNPFEVRRLAPTKGHRASRLKERVDSDLCILWKDQYLLCFYHICRVSI